MLLRSSAAHLRLTRAKEWLSARSAAEPILVVASSLGSANDLLRVTVKQKGAAFAWQRATLPQLAATLATPALVEKGLAPVGLLGCEAIAARGVQIMRLAGELGRYLPVAETPGFPRAVAHCLNELRLAEIPRPTLENTSTELATIYERYRTELNQACVADRAEVFALATETARDLGRAHALLGVPTLFLDVAVETEAERVFVQALATHATDVLATVPAGDGLTTQNLEKIFGVSVQDIAIADGQTSALSRLQAGLFSRSSGLESAFGENVVILSAPGESRECVEIARRVHRFAERGVPFDQMAVLLRSPDAYRAHLEEAFRRARIPAYFARGSVRPDPAGRAFFALLSCAAEGLSARRFAEYLSLSEVPDATEHGTPPGPTPAAERWVAPDEELLPEHLAEALWDATGSREDEDAWESPETTSADPLSEPVSAGTLRAPRHWEHLLVEAAVIGGRDRWERRLDGLAHQLRLDLESVEENDEPVAERIRRNLLDLQSLRTYALPLLDALVELPQRATWAEWLERLSALATSSLRHPDRVLSVLAELTPMGSVGPVDLNEVCLVLSKRLLEVGMPAENARYGRVFIGPVEAARGMTFDVVFVPGLAEKLFPQKIEEEPILLDSIRKALGLGLVTNDERIAHERLGLRLAVGAARDRIILSYPRLDMDQSRPRVPSFYAIEALRAAEGQLPGFDELAARAETTAATRVGWPAPATRQEAIDETEHDLALLDSLLKLDPERSVGAARYLLTVNPHLGRGLRFRARRWLKGWTVADGLVKPHDAGREAMLAHGLDARSYSPTALQNYATCPYKFLLYAIHKLTPREVPAAIEELDPLQRGSLVHDVQFELMSQLRTEGQLPVTRANLESARSVLDGVLDTVAARYREDLVPAIERVWEDGVSSVRADLREWLIRLTEDETGYEPWRFELAFGLSAARASDPGSQCEPVPLDCGIKLRGSIDLVERTTDGRLRVTDYKTGKRRVKPGAIVAGGESLQPILYALAVEKLFPDSRVDSGRLYYCTATGGFAESLVALNDQSRKSANTVADAIGNGLAEPFLPAAPAEGACRWCDYRVVCGPYEELRTRRKAQPPLASLTSLRALT